MSNPRSDSPARYAALVMLVAALVSAPALAQKSGASGSPRAPTRSLPARAAPPGPRATPRATPTTSPKRLPAPVESPQRVAPRIDNTAKSASKPPPKPRPSQVLSSGGYSPNGPGPVAPKRHAVSVKVGWPGSELGYLYGLRRNVSLGATINIGYGLEATPYPINVAAKGTVKWRFAKLGPLDAGVRFDFGYYYMNTVGHGLAVDASLLLHHQINKKLAIEPFLAIPMRILIASPLSVIYIPAYVGVAVEYTFIPKLTVFARAGIGGTAVVTIYNVPSGPPTSVDGKVFFEVALGVGYAF